MSQRERQLLAAFGQVAQGFDFETVMGASANLLRNAIRQSHRQLPDAEARLDSIVADIRAEMRRNDYLDDGTRNERRIVIPPLNELIPG